MRASVHLCASERAVQHVFSIPPSLGLLLPTTHTAPHGSVVTNDLSFEFAPPSPHPLSLSIKNEKRGAERSTMHSGHPARPRLPREHPAVHILVDCSYDALMSEDERRGLCRQLDCCVRSGASSRETWRCEMCCPARSFDAAWRECAGSTTGTGSRRGSTGARQQHGPAACA